MAKILSFGKVVGGSNLHWNYLGEITSAKISIEIPRCNELNMILYDASNNVYASHVIARDVLENMGSYYNLCGAYVNQNNNLHYTLDATMGFTNNVLSLLAEFHSQATFGKVRVYYR